MITIRNLGRVRRALGINRTRLASLLECDSSIITAMENGQNMTRFRNSKKEIELLFEGERKKLIESAKQELEEEIEFYTRLF